MYNDVIVALATPMMESALSIIRVSGDNSLELLKKIFSNKPVSVLVFASIVKSFVVSSFQIILPFSR